MSSEQQEFRDDLLRVQSIGPFQRFPVVVNEWTVPHLEARNTSAGVTLTLDHRLELDIATDTTPGQIIHFIADCIAVAKGYACHPLKDGWMDEDRTVSPATPKWPWSHFVAWGASEQE
jgi:hypothetical protein